MYKVALSAGKAHRDHKHHHVHHFDHNGPIVATTAAPTPAVSAFYQSFLSLINNIFLNLIFIASTSSPSQPQFSKWTNPNQSKN